MKVTCPNCGKVVKVKDTDGLMDEPLVRCNHCKKIFFTREPVPGAPEDEFDLDEEKGPTPDIHAQRHRQSKRYLVLMVLLLISVIAYQIFQYIRAEEALNHVRNVTARKVLLKLAEAQEAYYAGHGEYSGRPEELAEYFRIGGSIVVLIDRAGPSSWRATAYHPRSNRGYVYDSADRAMGIEEFEREEKKE